MILNSLCCCCCWSSYIFLVALDGGKSIGESWRHSVLQLNANRREQGIISLSRLMNCISISNPTVPLMGADGSSFAALCQSLTFASSSAFDVLLFLVRSQLQILNWTTFLRGNAGLEMKLKMLKLVAVLTLSDGQSEKLWAGICELIDNLFLIQSFKASQKLL